MARACQWRARTCRARNPRKFRLLTCACLCQSGLHTLSQPGACIATRYYSSFNPNCTCRELVAVLVMAPAVPDVFVPAADDVNVIRFGVLKFARLMRLNISARNCDPSRSHTVVVLNTE